MKFRLWTIALCLVAMLSLHVRAAVPEADIAKIREAAPSEAPAKPKKPRKLLVISVTKGFRHASIGHGVEALRIMGEKTGAYTIEHTEDVNALAADNLKRFDAICFLNTTGNLFDDPELRKGLADFIRNGKGMVGIHAATDTFYAWPEFGVMMGGYFDGHPWHEKVTLKIEDTEHACNQCFEGKDRYEIVDEIYQFKDEPYSRTRLRVLVSLDTDLTDMNKKGIKRTDGDFPVSWLQRYEKGRTFYCSLGHRNEIYWNPVVLRHYLAGIQFAFGDLEADTTPSAEFDAKAAADGIDELLAKVKTYDYDQSRESINQLADVVRATLGHDDVRLHIEKKMAALLEGDATFAAKQFVCRQLAINGSAASVPTLAKLLADEGTADIARLALEPNPSDEAGAALRAALGRARGSTLVGVINSIGARRDVQAVDALTKLAGGDDAAVRTAAVAALGRIGGDAAATALAKLDANSGALDALLLCADGFVASGDTAKARSIYASVYDLPNAPRATHVAALRGLLVTETDYNIDELAALLASDDTQIRGTAIAFIRDVPGAKIGPTLAAKLPSLSADTQALVIAALAERNEAALVPTFIKLVSHDDEAVRIAAIGALARTDGASEAVAVLSTSAAKRGGAERNAARVALERMRGEDVNAALAAVVKQGDAAVRGEAMRALAARGATSATPVLIQALGDDDPAVRAGAFDALGRLAGAAQYGDLVGAMVRASDRSERSAAERCVLAVARQMEAADATRPLLTAMNDASAAGQTSLLATLGKIGGNDALAAVRGKLNAGDDEVKNAAVRALADWPDTGAAEDLLKLAKSSDNATHKVLALRGLVRVLDLPSDREPGATMNYYKQAAALADRPEEKRLIIAGLSNQASDAALSLVQAYQRDDAVKTEADQAAAKIKAAMEGPPLASASHNSANAGNALDGHLPSRWDTGAPMKPGMWFMLDLKREKLIRSITLNTAPSANDYPRGYELYISNNPNNFGKPVLTGKGESPIVEITLPKPVRGRYIRIVQTGSSDSWYWSIHELAIDAE